MAKRILLIDDEKPVRDTFRLLLKQEGFLIETAINGEDALNGSASLKPVALAAGQGWQI